MQTQEAVVVEECVCAETAAAQALLADMLGRIARRDKEAFAAVFRCYAGRLKAFYMARGWEETAAEDIMQDTMVLLWQRAETFDPDRDGRAGAWLFVLAREQNDALRRRRDGRTSAERELWPDPYEVDIGPEDLSVRTDRIRRLQHELARLRPEEALLLRDAFVRGMSHNRIAAARGLPLGTVKAFIRRGVLKLREALKASER